MAVSYTHKVCPNCGYINAVVSSNGDVHCESCQEDFNMYVVDPDKKEKSLPHYTGKPIQPLDYILNNEMNFCEGNIIKYVTRYKEKNGVEDLRKARVYLDALIEYYNKKNEQFNEMGK